MKKNVGIIFALFWGITTTLCVQESQKSPFGQKTVAIQFENEELVDVVNNLAAQSCVNVLLPQGDQSIKNKVTFSLEKRVTVDEAWQLLDVILNLAGYSRLTQEDKYVITKNTETLPREPSPLFVGIAPEKIPDTEQQIRYLYFLSNIKVSNTDSDLTKLLATLLPKNSYMVDQATNGIIFSAKATEIKAAMKIITELDTAGFAEKLVIMNLRYASADVVAKLFNESILKKENSTYNRYRLDAKRQAEANYFSKNTRVISAQSFLGINALIVLGRKQAVDRIQSFIDTYIDIELESGQSILHIYELQYLDADKVRDVLQKVVDSSRSSETGQAKTKATTKTGTQRTFGEVIIQSDKSTDEKTQYSGGNKLLIAARNDDWFVLKELIEKLDQPRPQVLMEVIVADLTLEDLKQLGSSLRNPDKIPMPADVNIQSAQAPNGLGVVLDPSNSSPQTLKADLLNQTFQDSSGNAYSQAAAAANGSTVFSFNDNNGKTWSISQILQSMNKTKVLSAPHVIAINGQEAMVELGEKRLLPDESIGTSGSTTIKTKWVDATLTAKLTPRISSKAQTINMQVDISVEQYLGTNVSTRSSRKIVTNANVKDRDVLAIGGLIRTDTSDSTRKTPFLGDVPILGWFFKGRKKTINKTNLTVFISPIIIEPHLRKGMSPETKKAVTLMKAFADEGQLFDYLKEPVTRLFFSTELDNTKEIIDEFTSSQQVEEYQSFAENEQPAKNKKRTKLAKRRSKKTSELKKLARNEKNPLLGRKRRTS